MLGPGFPPRPLGRWEVHQADPGRNVGLLPDCTSLPPPLSTPRTPG